MAAFGFEVEYQVETRYKAKILINAPSEEEAYADVEAFVTSLPYPAPNDKIKRYLVYSSQHSPVSDFKITQIKKESNDDGT